MKLSTLIAGTGARGDPSTSSGGAPSTGAGGAPSPAAGMAPGDDPDIVRVTGDSREVVPGTCFFALPGAALDGHRFAADAASRGAVAVVAERPVECAPARLLLAPSARRAMALAAANFHGHPGDALKLAGV